MYVTHGNDCKRIFITIFIRFDRNILFSVDYHTMKATRYDKWIAERESMRNEVLRLHAGGMITAHIARQIGMPPQRVHQILYPHGKPPKEAPK